MSKATFVLDSSEPQRLGTSLPAVSVDEAEAPAGGWHGKRILTVDGKAAFEMSYWCGTCPFVFQRLEGANRTLSMDALTERLDSGLGEVDTSVVESVASLLPEADYVPLLLEIHPRLVFPGDVGDYFSNEQVTTWGIDSFWGLPENPRTPYYRTPTRVVADDARLFEFVVPIVPPNWNDRGRVERYADRLRQGSEPTCLALGVLDVRQQADWETPEGGLVHWGLAHYLLDGHHKIEAAAKSGRAVRLLSLVSVDSSLAPRDDVKRLADVLAAAPIG
ncbi:MAG: hypothetical protein QNJ81_02930 [Acidimicrobiia bacterium]|nr:hypothetical protein [Acidimicrobiia bacterium]